MQTNANQELQQGCQSFFRAMDLMIAQQKEEAQEMIKYADSQKEREEALQAIAEAERKAAKARQIYQEFIDRCAKALREEALDDIADCVERGEYATLAL